VWSSVEQVVSATASAALGRAIVNTRLQVVDPATGHLSPSGSPGELWIAGAGVTRGYLDRPELTAKRYVVDANGERWYRTGDLVMWRETGALQFLGRLDNQVKIRGYRIELGEIEAVIAEDAAVQEVVVMADVVAEGDPRLVAYLTRREMTPVDTGAIRQRLLRRLPDFMVPTRFVVLREMPRTPNLKIDRKALTTAPTVNDAGAVSPSGNSHRSMQSVPAQTGSGVVTLPASGNAVQRQLEQTIIGIWAEVLRAPVSNLHDNFFDLGGHSLLVVQVHQKLQAYLGRSFPVTDLFRFATVRAIAVHLAPLAAGAHAPSSLNDTAAGAPAVLSPTPAPKVASAEDRAARRLAVAQARLGRRD
jgi:acyl carrier protein